MHTTAPQADAIRRVHAAPRAWWWGCAIVLFPLLLWATSTLWFGGAGGKISDDWSLTCRDPVTQQAPTPFNPWARYPYFWRPLHIAMIFTVGTYAYDADWPVGVFVALMHLLAAWSLFVLMRAVTSSWVGPALAAMLWLVHPLQFEVSLWFSSTCAAIGLTLAIQLVLWQRRLLMRPVPPTFARRTLTWLGIFLFALAVPGFYEQPAAVLGAAPLLLLATIPWAAANANSASGRAGRHSMLVWFVRIVRVCIPAALACIAYVVLLVLTAPKEARGGGSSFVNSSNALDRFDSIAGSSWSIFGGERFTQIVRGAWELGVDHISTGIGLSVLVALSAAGIAWCILAIFASRVQAIPPSPANTPKAKPVTVELPAPPSPLRRLLFITGALAVLVFSLLPVAVLARQNLEIRNGYVPFAACAMLLAQVLDILWSTVALPGRLARARGHNRFGAIISTVSKSAVLFPIAAIMVLACICNVGTQEWLRRRSEADASLITQLRQQIPSPPPHAVFIPIRIAYTPSNTGEFMFDHLRAGNLAAIWAAQSMLTEAYRRRDLEIVAWNPWAAATVAGVATAGDAKAIVRVHPWKTGRDQVVDLRRVIPFTIDAKGKVHFVEDLTVESPSGQLTRLEFPLIAAHKHDTASPNAVSFPVTNAWLGIDLASAERLHTTDYRPPVQPDWFWSRPQAAAAAATATAPERVQFGLVRPWQFTTMNMAAWMRPATIFHKRFSKADHQHSSSQPHPTPTITTDLRGQMECAIPASTGGEPSRFTVRASFISGDMSRPLFAKGSHGADFTMVLRIREIDDQGAERELAHITLDPESSRRARRWQTAVVPLSGTQAHRLRLHLEAWMPHPKGGEKPIAVQHLPSVWVTAGAVFRGEADPIITFDPEHLEAPVDPNDTSMERVF